MNYRPLGDTGLRVSVLGLGTVKLGRNQQVKYPAPFAIPDDAAARRLLDAAADLGINLLDTAPAYGTSESRLGALLEGRRQDWVLCTKVGEEFDDGRSWFEFSADQVRRSIERSLTRLRTDWLDVVLIHSDGRDVEILERGEVLETLLGLKARGTIRAVGMSHKTMAGGLRALELGCDVIMTTLNREDASQADVIARAGRQHCGVLVKKALASGHDGLDSLRFAATQPGVSSVVVGTVNPEHLRDNARALADM